MGPLVNTQSGEALDLRLPFVIGLRRCPINVRVTPESGHRSALFASLDEGENWQEIARHLPTILAVEALERR